MQNKAYREWLILNENSPNTVNTRSATLLKLERSLQALGSPDRDLDAAWKHDRFENLNNILDELLIDFRNGGERYKILSPEAAAPDKAVYSHRTHLKNYGLFLAEEEKGLERSDWIELERMRHRFLRIVGDFIDFSQNTGRYFEQERRYKDEMREATARIISSPNLDNASITRQIFLVLEKGERGKGGLFRWQTRDAIEKAPEELRQRFFDAVSDLLRTKAADPSSIYSLVRRLSELHEQGLQVLKIGEVWAIALTLAGIMWPELAAPFKIMKARDLGKQLINDPIFVHKVPQREELDSWLGLLNRIFVIMRDIWGWKPKDLIDVQGFIWVAIDKEYGEEEQESDDLLQPVEGNAQRSHQNIPPTNLIFHGPPGTGKTWSTAYEAVRLCDGSAPDERSTLMDRYDALVKSGRIAFVTFHQSYSYEDFIEGFRPVPEHGGQGLKLEARPGVFRRISAAAEKERSLSENPDSYVLIIDEINRANISKVFGELITLIEPDKRLGQRNALSVQLPYTGDTFGVPDNLHLIGTMNTADRSIALLDTALRRRFEFREVMPDPALLESSFAEIGVDLANMLRVINLRIEYLFDREHQVGHAFFLDCQTKSDVDKVMRYKIIPLLCEYFYEDWQKVAVVLGDANGEGRFLQRMLLPVPAGMEETQDEPIWRWSVKNSFADDAYEDFR